MMRESFMEKQFVAFNSCRNCKYLESDGEDGYSYVYCSATNMGNLRTFPFKKAMKCFEVDFHHRPQFQERWHERVKRHFFIRFVLFEKHWGWTWKDHTETHCQMCVWGLSNNERAV